MSDPSGSNDEKKDDITAQVAKTLGDSFPGHKMVVIILNEDKGTCDLAMNADIGIRKAAEVMAHLGTRILTDLNSQKPTKH